MAPDRISHLPQNLLETILCFLPIQDAVRTSTLSKEWRHRWTTIPHLIFDCLFCLWDSAYRESNPQAKALKYVSVINRVLLLHNGPIHKFSLPFSRYWSCDAQIVHEFIDQWITVLSRNGIKVLFLEEDYEEFERFAPHNFSGLNLTHLRFSSGLFPYTPTSGGFTNLIILELFLVTSDYRQSIFDCPVLKKLTLLFCEGLLPINFRAPNLECLRQAYDEITLEYAISGLENLKEYSCMVSRNTIMQTKTPNVVKVLGSLNKVEKFSTGRNFLAYLAAGGCPNRLSQPLQYLKTLNSFGTNFFNKSDISCLLCLIRSAPNLWKLHIENFCNDEEDLEEYQIEDSEDFTIDHLEIVTFGEFRGQKAEFELVKFLLGHSLSLKTMYIHCNLNIPEDVAFRMEEEIMQYYRASSRAQIRDLKHCPYLDDFDLKILPMVASE